MITSFITRLTLSAAAAASLAPLSLHAQEQVIPRPAEITIEQHGKALILGPGTEIVLSENLAIPAKDGKKTQPCKEAAYAIGYLRQGTGLKLPAWVNGLDTPTALRKARATYAFHDRLIFSVDTKLLQQHGPEAYTLQASFVKINPDKEQFILNVKIASPKAIVPAVQTIAQMLPPAFFDPKADKSQIEWKLADAPFTVTDYPRYAWRSFMLDEARYFYGVDAVKKIIDQMTLLKMNVLHWHLSDDGGWRIEIKKYPKLTAVGSKRRDTEIEKWGSGKYSGKPHEGYYTQDQIRDIVAYAAERGITIIPEIDVPGHSAALCASYPELKLTLKQPSEVPATFTQNIALDPTNEKVYEVLSDILDEIITLFPSPIIHLGGDEVRHKDCWQGEPAIEEFMKKKGLKSLNDVQTYFTNRMSQILAQKGRRMMGWNEILGHDIHGDGGGTTTGTLAPNTVINYWYGKREPVIEAAKKGHDIVNSEWQYTYMTKFSKPDLRKSYSFDPALPGLTPEQQKRVLGMACHTWTEWIPDTDELYRQMYPRIIALAETAWTSKERKNYDDFLKRVRNYTRILDAMDVKFDKTKIK